MSSQSKSTPDVAESNLEATAAKTPPPEVSTDKSLEKAKINLETARIAWAELQRFFAAGKVLELAAGEDLTEVAQRMADDDAQHLRELLDAQKLGHVQDARAVQWIESDAEVWCVVVKPWVLVQDID